MSGILSVELPDAVIVMTDGSAYDDDFVLTDIRRKIIVSEKLPLAVARRGNAALGKLVSRKIIELAEAFGFDQMIADVKGALATLPSELPVEILIAGISESAGPVHRMFRSLHSIESDRHFEHWFHRAGTWEERANPVARETEPTLIDPGRLYFGFGGDGRNVKWSDLDVPDQREDEPLQDWFAKNGVKIFEFFRRIPIPTDPFDVNCPRVHLIGGILDMTVVTPRSVSTTLLHRWPDKIGERIDPFRDIEKTREAA
ncbi:hypothetical protein [Mesorhizobium sp. M4B.F.Ca.ET.013.02.1.1]|uniref:hypothetical protein n=1 Tax=Mesorhizobium sp. M4B.F.Ca.ET.013.02.1.1 TaxID=2496755 RepID=UPI000FD30CFA|nr:hypothetical protein [Mesorhizobium sp. M4B.F.Ca.ET.013.02.1.1]RUW19192.1 hypothetical protein EOA34_30250 [Mesorhizobium sp. M4B.F.Ca.ET.013.02.1.1]